MDGKGSMAGTKSPALFSDLEFAQELQSKTSKVNMLRVSLVDEEDARGTVSAIEDILDDLIDAEDSGFEITTEGDSMSISNGEGLGRLDGEFHGFLVRKQVYSNRARDLDGSPTSSSYSDSARCENYVLARR